MIRNSKQKIAVALSGGVDSAVVAKILKDEGHQVIGLFLRLWKYDGEDMGLLEARTVAEFLNIPLYEIEAEQEFKEVVVKNFIAEYKNLRTPNPCTLCNPEIKFKLLIDKAMELGCEKVATGHYARIENSEITNIQETITNKYPNSKYSNKKQFNNTAIYHLLAGIDATKDQSYMLYRLTQDQLSKVIFPLGELTKKEVREMAKKWGLPVAEQKESQEICFLQNTDYRHFLKEALGESHFKHGEIIDTKNNVVGRHEGLINYTIGQRRGVDQKHKNRRTKELKNVNTVIPSHSQVLREVEESLYNKKPLYVIGFDIKKNRLIVGEDEEVYKNEMTVSDLYWISPLCHSERGTSRGIPFDSLSVKIRSQAKKVKCKFSTSHPDWSVSGVEGSLNNKEISPPVRSSSQSRNDKIGVEFDQPQRAITPGQSAVFYLRDEVIGGGIIEK